MLSFVVEIFKSIECKCMVCCVRVLNGIFAYDFFKLTK